ncbi:hypothetical protein ANANG_G00303650 [Anguilla anguilla]|uniref:Uncharacterized protein n=1 Tax=Anguilla anguilla TaxID=7936 RepID=A0A9D3RI55_ANGAN|nr:hypothetical protein ANANG_G00303650 [Anguilla anguilla]
MATGVQNSTMDFISCKTALSLSSERYSYDDLFCLVLCQHQYQMHQCCSKNSNQNCHCFLDTILNVIFMSGACVRNSQFGGRVGYSKKMCVTHVTIIIYVQL